MATRSGSAALAGATNAGKSTLFNRLVGERLSIATPKAQTTRLSIKGIVIATSAEDDRTEIVVLDLPGIFRPRRALDRAMVAAAWRGAQAADVILFVVDAKARLSSEVSEIARRLAEMARPVWLVLNKVDLVPKPSLLPLAASLNALSAFGKTFMLSAATGDGVSDLSLALAGAMPEGPHLYPAGQISDLTERNLAAEIVREQIFLQCGDEVPYDAAVETESWQEQKDGSVRIGGVVTVARGGQKAILIGAGGRRIRMIGTRARAVLAASLGRTVHLVLRVEERPGWDEDQRRITALGLREPQER
ncbi:MAG: GTPase Era [Acetobacteraceae bacterium]